MEKRWRMGENCDKSFPRFGDFWAFLLLEEILRSENFYKRFSRDFYINETWRDQNEKLISNVFIQKLNKFKIR